MADYLCYRCSDQGGSCCCQWCHQTNRWHFIRCSHMDCWAKNGRTGISPAGRTKIVEWP